MKNFLVVKLSAIGDVIHALPVAYAIKETYPDSRLTWVIEPPAYPLAEACPHIDRLILFKKKEIRSSLKGFLKNVPPLRHELKSEKYDVSMDLQGLFKSAVIVHAAGAKLKLGTCNMREMSDRVSRPVVGEHHDGHIVERYLDVARAAGCKADEVRFDLDIPAKECKNAEQTLEWVGVKATNDFAVLAVGANWPNKRWSADSFARFADWLYGQKIVPVLVGGGAVDAATAADIESKAEIPPLNLVNKTTLRELAHVMRKAVLAVGGDTGPVHLASLLGTRTVMLMGPTDANRNGPYRGKAIEVNRDCRYCWQRSCPKKLDCLSAIEVDEVIHAAR